MSTKKFFVGTAVVVDFGGRAGGGCVGGGGVGSVGGGCVEGGVCAPEGVAAVRISPAASHSMHVVFVIRPPCRCVSGRARLQPDNFVSAARDRHDGSTLRLSA